MSIFRVRKVAFINFGLLLIFLASWVSWYIYPLEKSLIEKRQVRTAEQARNSGVAHLAIEQAFFDKEAFRQWINVPRDPTSKEYQ